MKTITLSVWEFVFLLALASAYLSARLIDLIAWVTRAVEGRRIRKVN